MEINLEVLNCSNKDTLYKPKSEKLENWNKFERRLKDSVNLESAICHVNSVLGLGWEPACDKGPLAKILDGNLKRHYVVNVLRQDGSIERGVPASTQWVEESFKGESLAAVQKSFMQSVTRVEVMSKGKKYLQGRLCSACF